jgi:hypothetical protein
MHSGKNESLILAIKDTAAEHPIPTAWRPVICKVVSAFVRHDYQLNAAAVPGVAQVSSETVDQISSYIQDYGAELVDLPEETWDSSVCIWQGNRWDALIDLWSLSEGRSDLVLSLQVSEAQGGLEFAIYMVYVP